MVVINALKYFIKICLFNTISNNKNKRVNEKSKSRQESKSLLIIIGTNNLEIMLS